MLSSTTMLKLGFSRKLYLRTRIAELKKEIRNSFIDFDDKKELAMEIKELEAEHCHIDNMQWAIDKTDKFLEEKELLGEGRWCNSFVYKDSKGVQYEIWIDQEGDSKVVENV